jgi:hypothetical protein
MLACVLVTAFPAAALADGGTQIANAPELQSGVKVSGAVSRADFWRFTIATGDTLRIDYEPVATYRKGDSMGVCLMTPDITDFTVNDKGCLAYGYSDRKKQLLHEAFPIPGRYTLVVGHYNCVNSDVNTQCNPSNSALSYEFTLYIVHRTSTTLRPLARLANKGSSLNVRGQVKGATSGSVAIQQRAGGRWANVKITKVAKDGRFATKIKLNVIGAVRYRVFYPGDESHKPSTATFRLTVG